MKEEPHMKKLLSILLACVMLLSCAALAEGTVLRMATPPAAA